MSAATKQERRFQRWSTRIPVRFEIWGAKRLDFERFGRARARDIGAGGLFLQGAQLERHTRIHFFFELPETWGGCVEAFGEVVHGRAHLDTMGFEIPGVGVRILRMPERDRARLDAYLRERSRIDAAVLSASQVRLRALSKQRQFQ
jgi:hypothetical protein